MKEVKIKGERTNERSKKKITIEELIMIGLVFLWCSLIGVQIEKCKYPLKLTFAKQWV